VRARRVKGRPDIGRKRYSPIILRSARLVKVTRSSAEPTYRLDELVEAVSGVWRFNAHAMRDDLG
jgi:hypothetical protein